MCCCVGHGTEKTEQRREAKSYTKLTTETDMGGECSEYERGKEKKGRYRQRREEGERDGENMRDNIDGI